MPVKFFKIIKSLPKDTKQHTFFDTIGFYCLAILLPCLIFLLMLAIDPHSYIQIVGLFFFPCIVLATWIGGFKPGILSSYVAAVLMFYFFFHHTSMFPYLTYLDIFQLFLFLGESILLVILVYVGKHQRDLYDYQRSEKKLAEKVEELERILAGAKKEIKSRDEFLSIASHELKTPLTSMLLQTQNALHNIRNVSLAHFSIESLLKMLESVENQTKRLSKMINDLLNISLITTGNMQLVYEKIDLNLIIDQVIAEFAPRIEKEHYEVVFEHKEPIIGSWDSIRIQQAVANLISNAIKYGDQKPIHIITQKNHNSVQIIVTDSGIGISKDQQKKIFGLYERAVSPEQYKGLGVGLYITHQIIKAHGGSIAVSSKVGHGSTFTIRLPLTENKKN